MLHLVSLVCHGCESIGASNFFYDHTTKRPHIGDCRHSMCTQCVKKNIRCPSCMDIECSKCTRQIIPCDDCRRLVTQTPAPNCARCIRRVRRCNKCNLKTYFQDSKSLNYDYIRILEDCEKDCFNVYRNWWNGAETGKGACANCHDEALLRICIDCNATEQVSAMKCLWKYKEKPMKVEVPKEVKPKKEAMSQDLKDLFGFESDSESEYEVPPPPPLPVAELRLSVFGFKHHLSLLKANLLCSDCILETSVEDHQDEFRKVHEPHHKNTKLKDIPFWNEDIKSATAQYAGEFLWKVMQREATNLCQLRYMRLLRTCEALIHWASLHCPFNSSRNFEPIGFQNDHYWTHRRKKSRVSKYFEALDFEEKPQKEVIDLLIDGLKWQLEELKKVTSTCPCTEKYNQLKQAKLGNQVEKEYCVIIYSKELHQQVIDCPLKWPSSSGNLKNLEAQEVYWDGIGKLYLLPTIFCWNPRINDSGMCHVFDNASHKPFKCPRCSISTCLKCLEQNFILDCPHCGWCFQHDLVTKRVNPEAIYTIDEDVLELAECFKKKSNALEIYKNWKGMEVPAGHGYCMSCHSYTSQLEICVYCELAEKETTLHRSFFGDLEFKNDPRSLSKLPRRWQCAECTRKLLANWEHSKCEDFGNKKYTRGCNHLRNRLNDGCSSSSNCARSIVALKDIKGSEHVWKAATWHIVKELLGEMKDLDGQKLEMEVQEFLNINLNAE